MSRGRLPRLQIRSSASEGMHADLGRGLTTVGHPDSASDEELGLDIETPICVVTIHILLLPVWQKSAFFLICIPYFIKKKGW